MTVKVRCGDCILQLLEKFSMVSIVFNSVDRVQSILCLDSKAYYIHRYFCANLNNIDQN